MRKIGVLFETRKSTKERKLDETFDWRWQINLIDWVILDHSRFNCFPKATTKIFIAEKFQNEFSSKKNFSVGIFLTEKRRRLEKIFQLFHRFLREIVVLKIRLDRRQETFVIRRAGSRTGRRSHGRGEFRCRFYEIRQKSADVRNVDVVNFRRIVSTRTDPE